MEFKLKPSHETRICLLALTAGLPAVIAACTFLFLGSYSVYIKWILSGFLVGCWLWLSVTVRKRVATPLRTLASLVEAVREGDYAVRARIDNPEEPLGEVMSQINAIADTLHQQRLGVVEATALLRKVMQEIDVAIFAFDPLQTLRLANRAGEKLIGDTVERLGGLSAVDVGLADFLIGPEQRVVQRTFPGAAGRWNVSRTQFREGGLPHALLVITDLTKALREEELKAWQKLVRVIGHELNNSLTPIKSIAQSLQSIIIGQPMPDEMREDLTRGLHVIASRSESLSRFMSAYARLARMPAPVFAPVELKPIIERVATIETRMRIHIGDIPPVFLYADIGQLEHALINLISNAVDASMETGGQISIEAHRCDGAVQIVIRDEGPGLADTANLFVPFFTTKRGGSGIGLVFSRQVAEAHRGTLTLTNAQDEPGCEAILTLPIAAL